MNKKVKNIEHLYRESFEDFRLEPSSGLWKRISSRLTWKTFIKFNPTTLNAYYLTGILAVSIAGALWIINPVSDDNQEIKEITIIEPIETQPITQVQEESRKAEGRGQKAEGSIQKSVPEKQNSSSSAIVTTKAENQKPESGINDPKPVTRNTELVTLNPKPVTPNLQLVTRNSKLVTPEPVTRNSQPVTPEPSNQSLDPWLNIDSLFTNQTPTPPQHSIQFPNAFTPNPNGPTNGYYTPGIPNNDVFHPEYKGVVEYHLRIFNRRGELLFESNDINVGWDGYINDRLAAQDVYIWKAQGRYSNGLSFTKFGNVMLIKK